MIDRGRWVEALLAALAVLVVGWPVGHLVDEQPWLAPLVGVLALLVVVGSVCRAVGSPRWLVPLTQLLAALVAISWLVSHEGAASPEESFVTAANRLVAEGAETIATFPVPAPATAGLSFIVLTGLVLVAIVVDAVAVTFAAPALAGVPLLLMAALSASNTGEPLHPGYFVAAAAAWLLLLARQSRGVVAGWVRRPGAPTTSAASAAASAAVRRSGTAARALTAGALAVAVTVPALLPHLPPTALIDGLSRSGSGTGGQVTFVETLDLAEDLADRSRTPVIRYRTDAVSPPPLRITASARYEDGKWLPAEHRPDRLVAAEPADLPGSQLEEHGDAGVRTSSSTITVTQNRLRAPQLAVPHLSTDLDLGGTEWQWDPLGDVPLVAGQPPGYRATFAEVSGASPLPTTVGDPTGGPQELQALLARVTETGAPGLQVAPDGTVVAIIESDGTVHELSADARRLLTGMGGDVRELSGVLDVDPASADLVSGLAEDVVGEATNQLDVAAAIQQYLRGSAFSYSLTLADPVLDESGDPLDPVSHFLHTRQGYCTQFATLMVMMARSQGIPARLAVGFLPGRTGADGARTVVAADAHAWPELFINGLGWTRYEPTPSSRAGTAPFYPTPVESAPAPPAPEVTEAPEPSPEPLAPEVPTGQDGAAAPGSFSESRTVVLVALGGLVGALVALSVTPLAGWGHRRRLRARHGRTSPIEREWATLQTGLDDRGVAARDELSPRAAGRYYEAELVPEAAVRDALWRAAGRVEDARYAPVPPPAGTMAADVRRVLRWRHASLSRRQRLAVALVPRSGRRGLRRLLEGSHRAPRRSAPVAH